MSDLSTNKARLTDRMSGRDRFIGSVLGKFDSLNADNGSAGAGNKHEGGNIATVAEDSALFCCANNACLMANAVNGNRRTGESEEESDDGESMATEVAAAIKAPKIGEAVEPSEAPEVLPLLFSSENISNNAPANGDWPETDDEPVKIIVEMLTL